MPETKYYVDELRQSIGRTLTERFPILPFQSGDDIPVEPDFLEPGTATVSVDVMTGSGEAILRAPGSSEIPLVQINMTRDEYPVVMAVAGYSFTFDETRSLSKAGKLDLVKDRKTIQVRRVIAEKLNHFAAYGDSGLGITGFVNNRAVSPVNSSVVVPTLTFYETVDYFLDVILRLGLNSRQTVYTTDISVAPHIMNHLKRTVSNENETISALQVIRNRVATDDPTNPPPVFRERAELGRTFRNIKGVPTPDRDLIVVYNRSLQTLSRQIESNIADTFPPEFVGSQNGVMTIPMYSVATATMVHEPGAVSVHSHAIA